MSDATQIHCPNCGTIFEATLYDVVARKAAEELRAQLAAAEAERDALRGALAEIDARAHPGEFLMHDEALLVIGSIGTLARAALDAEGGA